MTTEAAGSSPQARGAQLLEVFGLGVHGLIPAGAGSTLAPAARRTRWAAHPRRRGEHASASSTTNALGGSSPQARGAPQPARGTSRRVGLIPAGAGSTPAPSSTRRAPTAHPRRRGEHASSATSMRWQGGSSPQARGARAREPVDGHQPRLIPAGAGSTQSPHAPCAPRPAHPRRRGEHGTVKTARVPGNGSSPQARGAHGPEEALREVLRLIPAGAGSTPVLPWSVLLRGAHPRRRGEHGGGVDPPGDGVGSSPQARGARPVDRHGGGVAGLIPAGAGSTPTVSSLVCGGGAHPRRRGEHVDRPRRRPRIVGSSPQARGALREAVVAGGHGGLIPAGAGSTAQPTPGPCWGAAHPRRRGEHVGRRLLRRRRIGSSPQARGARHGVRPRSGVRGLIPAGAGSTPGQRCPAPRSAAHPRRRGEHNYIAAGKDPKKGSSPQARGAP